VEASWQQGQQESLARHVFRIFNNHLKLFFSGFQDRDIASGPDREVV
jgi:hypothetical protein